jgi:type II secretory pathway pseudopilin PulG
MTPRLLRSSAGFTYIAALVMVVIMGIMLSQAAGYWKMRMQREREVELIFRGTQIRDAMRRWYKLSAASPTNPLPGQATTAQATTISPNSLKLNELKDLLQDPNSPAKVRYLRRLYLDPMTGKDFVPVKDANQRIIGVRSESEEEPIKKANFPLDLDQSDFEGKKKYSEWQFICTHWPKSGASGGVKGLSGASTPAGTGTGGNR